jgi:hypothetical protein
LFLRIKKVKVVSLKGWSVIFAFFLLTCFLVQQYLTWCLTGISLIFLALIIWSFIVLEMHFLFYQFAFSAAFAVYFVAHRKFLPTIILVLSVFLSRFMLLPVLALFLAFCPKENKLRFLGRDACYNLVDDFLMD